MTSQLLHEGWSALGGEPGRLAALQTVGEPGGLLSAVLPARDAMIAAVATATLAAADLDAARNATSACGAVVDIEHIAVAARSERYARRIGAPALDPFAPLSRFWQTGDGWLRTHANYPWHRQRLLEVLDCPEDPEDVAAAIGRWRGAELEEVLAAAGALGFVVRTEDEWARHPQGCAVAQEPLIGRRKSSGRGRQLGAGRVCEGLRVLDLTRVIAGPVATRVLAAWGANVLRLDSPFLPELEGQAVDTLPGKRSAEVDFTTEPAALAELLSNADVVVQGYRPGSLERFGLCDTELVVRHPQLTVVTLCAWGWDGPWSQRRGFDSLVQCATGIAAVEGHDGLPGVLPAQVLDHATGYLAAAAVMRSAAETQQGEGPSLWRLSLARTAAWLQAGPRSPSHEPSRTVDHQPYLVTLSGPSGPVQVVGPPGRLADFAPSWSGTAGLGADRPSFESAV